MRWSFAAMIELTKAPCNSLLEVKSFTGMGGWQKRLEAIGIRKGIRLKKITCQPFGGPIVVDVNGTKISLGRGIASKIQVELAQHVK